MPGPPIPGEISGAGQQTGLPADPAAMMVLPQVAPLVG
jgi:hypothetical protein